MAEVIATDEFKAWYRGLDDDTAEDVNFVVTLLEERGVVLPFPYSSVIQGSKYALRELRVQSAGRPIRIFYAFDPSRQAVLLIGGDKTGDDRFYETFVPLAEKIWEQYRKETQ